MKRQGVFPFTAIIGQEEMKILKIKQTGVTAVTNYMTPKNLW